MLQDNNPDAAYMHGIEMQGSETSVLYRIGIGNHHPLIVVVLFLAVQISISSLVFENRELR